MAVQPRAPKLKCPPFWCVVLLGCLLAPSLTPAATLSPGEAATAHAYYVRPIGEVDPAHLRFACRTISEVFRVRCKIMRSQPLPRAALDPARNQYDADALVRGLFYALPNDALGLVALTNADLAEPGDAPFIFGLASLVDHVAVVSMARYRSAWWGEPRDPVRFTDRLYKVLVHEVAHTLGLGHCPNQRCAMRVDRTIEALDTSPRRFCRACRTSITARLKEGPGTASWHYTRGHSHLLRGELAQAVLHFEYAVELDPADALKHNDLGVAYLRRGDTGRALWCFRYAQSLAPLLASAHYNEGLVHLNSGLAIMALAAFEATLSADPSWGLAHRRLGALLEDNFDDPVGALAHYEAYLSSHGADPAIEARVQMIQGGGRHVP